MKWLIVSLFVLNIGVKFGFSEELPGLNPLKVHLAPCCERGIHGRVVEAFMGPCFNTPGCKIPDCCGIIAGRESVFKIIYYATVPFTNGTFNGNLGGFALGPDGNQIEINLPIDIVVPPTLAGYGHNLCAQTKCPQRVGQRYELTIPFRFVTTVLTTLGIKNNFICEIKTNTGKTAVCYGLWATLVNADLAKSVVKTVDTVLRDPIGSIVNLDDTLDITLTGIAKSNVRQFPAQPPTCDD